jgi:DNA-directed RNA polymerase specialized sigma24 family protein
VKLDTVTIDGKQFQQLMMALQKTSDMLALNLVKDFKTQREKIESLADMGYASSDIAKILNINSGTVRKDLLRARTAKDSKKTEQEPNDNQENEPTNE